VFVVRLSVVPLVLMPLVLAPFVLAPFEFAPFVLAFDIAIAGRKFHLLSAVLFEFGSGAFSLGTSMLSLGTSMLSLGTSMLSLVSDTLGLLFEDSEFVYNRVEHLSDTIPLRLGFLTFQFDLETLGVSAFKLLPHLALGVLDRLAGPLNFSSFPVFLFEFGIRFPSLFLSAFQLLFQELNLQLKLGAN